MTWYTMQPLVKCQPLYFFHKHTYTVSTCVRVYQAFHITDHHLCDETACHSCMSVFINQFGNVHQQRVYDEVAGLSFFNG